MLIRRHIVFTRQVQGVGFCWRAMQVARLYNSTGWCRNDSVTMEIQGGEKAIDRVLQSIEFGRYVWSQNMDVTPMVPDPEERGFGVKD